MKYLIIIALFISSVGYSDAFDTLVRKSNEQNALRVISLSDAQLSLQDASGRIIEITRPAFNDLMAKISLSQGMDKFKAFLNGEPLDRSTHLKIQRGLVYASDFMCVGTGGTCIFMASSAIVFWPNGIIAGACGALAWGCDKYAASIIDELNEQIKIEEAKNVGGHVGDPVRKDPPAPFVPSGTSGSGTIWFNPPKPKVIITDM